MPMLEGRIVIIGVEDATRKVVGVPDERIGETMDVFFSRLKLTAKLKAKRADNSIFGWTPAGENEGF